MLTSESLVDLQLQDGCSGEAGLIVGDGIQIVVQSSTTEFVEIVAWINGLIDPSDYLSR
jgi:hypothetical protein